MHSPISELPRFLRLALCLLAASAGACGAMPALTPYEPDDHTLHLWHLDERQPPFLDAMEPGLDMLGLLCAAEAGQPAMADFGNSVWFNNFSEGEPASSSLRGAILLAAAELHNHGGDNAPEDFRYAGADGAFTFEALIRFEVTPTAMANPSGGIITMDGEAENRVFNFRVERGGFLSFIPLTGQGLARGGALAAIPTTGPHAVNTSDWFHVAVTYDGNEGAAENLKLYWTRLDAARQSAHIVGRGTLFQDLSRVSDFAIGNEARGASGQEPFPGWIDEVRMSSVARDRTDFLMVVPEKRLSPERARLLAGREEPLRIGLSSLMVDGLPKATSAFGGLELPPSTRRLDFDFGVESENTHYPVRFRCRLKGFDEQWEESARGMSLTCEVLDSRGDVVSMVRRPILGTSAGWQTGEDDSELLPWSEPLFLPETGKTLRMVFSSGADDTVGICVIDDLDVSRGSPDRKPESLWKNVGFTQGDRTRFPYGVPEGWTRGGSAPTIARLSPRVNNPALALVDGDQAASGTWTAMLPLPPVRKGGETVVLHGKEMFNVIGGNRHRVTYNNIPPGEYTFEAVAVGIDGRHTGSHMALPLTILVPVTSRPWFWVLLAACVVGSLAIGLIAVLRQRATRKLDRLRLRNALAQDRARIARDMHDDLGTRITLLTMNASLARRDLKKSPETAERHLDHLTSASRNLVTAMDDMVWAIDPKNDSLDHLAEHIAHLANEIFQGGEVRCAVEIPHLLPERQLRSDFRHHISLAVKESLHNILRHAGPCEASLTLDVEDDWLHIVIEDQGRGFDTSSPDAGNGLANLTQRLAAVGGNCSIDSTPGTGTRVVMRCPLPCKSVTKSQP